MAIAWYGNMTCACGKSSASVADNSSGRARIYICVCITAVRVSAAAHRRVRTPQTRAHSYIRRPARETDAYAWLRKYVYTFVYGRTARAALSRRTRLAAITNTRIRLTRVEETTDDRHRFFFHNFFFFPAPRLRHTANLLPGVDAYHTTRVYGRHVFCDIVFTSDTLQTPSRVLYACTRNGPGDDGAAGVAARPALRRTWGCCTRACGRAECRTTDDWDAARCRRRPRRRRSARSFADTPRHVRHWFSVRSTHVHANLVACTAAAAVAYLLLFVLHHRIYYRFTELYSLTTETAVTCVSPPSSPATGGYVCVYNIMI